MRLPHFNSLAALAATAALALATGCAPKAGSNPVDAATPASVTNPAPVATYHFAEPASEGDLQASSVYGYLIAKTAPGFDPKTFEHMGFKIDGKLSLKGFDFWHLYRPAQVMEGLEALKVTRGVLAAEPDSILTADAGITMNNIDPLVPSAEWSLYLTKTMDAWKTYGFGPNTPTVVDIDTGINWTHEDFQKGGASIVQHAYSWYDLDNGNALVMPTSTYAIDPIDYINSTAHTDTDDKAHGSHTAGTIAAQGNNGKGVAGVCWNANLVSYKGLLNGSGGTWAIYGSLYHLLNWKQLNGYNHTIPVNMSLGGPTASVFAIEVVEACTENNIAIIASMGNTGQNMVQYPAGYQGVIAVGATNGQDKKVHFSTMGPHISVAAPGYDIISTANGAPDAYESMSGTSMAAPFVTGLVSYMLTFNPDLTPAQIRTYLEKNTDLIEGATGFTQTTGYGRVNTLKTIAAVVADVNANTAPATNYLNTPLRVTVQNTYGGVTTVLPNTPVYLYRCDPTGVITNFVASSITSADTDSLLNPAGTADFNLLRPGTYLARCNISGIQAYSQLVTVTTTSDHPAITVQFRNATYAIQTLPDATAASVNTDDIVTVYDATSGRLLANVDNLNLDTALVMTSANQILMINIRPYTTHVGEYALWVGTSLYPTTQAPGTFAAPATAAGSASHSSASPQAINVNTLYNGNLTASTDWYRVTVP